ncbi:MULTISPECIES: AAA family ATPase [Mesorhizobium]|uniref:AAA family ATPase n=1 Tax=Mesorhizobium huakuii TaxID=28104 RepID=A0ABZ0VJ68_9HYPH|nr:MULTISPECIES: AAA family ATPase [Mesorhizobium]MBZ9910305.1 ATP-binding protein [Mesorhizobium sp. BR115XR7A]WQB97068.1 AAA family ATPase [Mesorhizobium huakuii]
MFFTVLAAGVRPPSNARSRAFLVTDNWDDWFEFSTMYFLTYVDTAGEQHDIGSVKIGQVGMEKGQRRPNIPNRFDALDDPFFALGQDDTYYAGLNDLGPELRDRILEGLRDVALDADLFERSLDERVTGISLLRSVTPQAVRGQYRRMARGGARVTPYELSYTTARDRRSDTSRIELTFAVSPEVQPPTNIHVITGRNGVGKTHLLNSMTESILNDGERAKGRFVVNHDGDDTGTFTGLVSVSFSAFDDFTPLSVPRDKSSGLQYSYIGLKKVGLSPEGKPLAPKSPNYLGRDFAESVQICRRGARASRWRRALQMLEADPIFKDADVAQLAAEDEDDASSEASRLFGQLSSGHKIVLLTITRLVETVEERTLVLLDEPEAHLHPPLLSAFVRALSDLLINRNGVAIIATHSPVVLQEVPMSCVWKVRRNGRTVIAERPEIETFGENVGILTREIFGLEVTDSGFHKMLRDKVEEGGDFEDILEHFGGRVGLEGQAIIRGLIAARDADGHE